MGLFGNLIGQRFEELACKPAPRSQWQEWLADVLLNAACACSSDRVAAPARDDPERENPWLIGKLWRAVSRK